VLLQLLDVVAQQLDVLQLQQLEQLQLDDVKPSSWSSCARSRTSNVSPSISSSSSFSSGTIVAPSFHQTDADRDHAQLLVLPQLQLVVDVVLPQLQEQLQQLDVLQLQQLVLHRAVMSSDRSAMSTTSNVSLSSSSSSSFRSAVMSDSPPSRFRCGRGIAVGPAAR
jgi:hypothetical protein